jgi:uncharacterized protein (TIGR04222 family)
MLDEPVPNSEKKSIIPKLLFGFLAILLVVAIAKIIADMHGPDFLLFYSVVITITLLVSVWLLQDPTKNQPLRLIPSEPDPYEIAYLRSEEKGVANVAVIDLIQRGYLQVSEHSISQATNHPDVSQLTPIQHQIFDWFVDSRTATEMLLVGSLTQDLQPHCIIYQQQLQNEQLLTSVPEKARRQLIGLIGMLLILTLGGFKLVVALVNGHSNVGVLIFMGFVATCWLSNISQIPPRLSSRGKKYLKQLEETFVQLKQKVKGEFPSEVDCNLVVAIFGVNALTGTRYDYYPKLVLPVMTKTSSSSSSGGCGSSSSCGGGCNGSCGGGCGGCGGCGGGGD